MTSVFIIDNLKIFCHWEVYCRYIYIIRQVKGIAKCTDYTCVGSRFRVRVKCNKHKWDDNNRRDDCHENQSWLFVCSCLHHYYTHFRLVRRNYTIAILNMFVTILWPLLNQTGPNQPKVILAMRCVKNLSPIALCWLSITCSFVRFIF